MNINSRNTGGLYLKIKKAVRLTYRYKARKETRTLDINLGKVALYQLSYSRVNKKNASEETRTPIPKAPDPKSSVSTNFTTLAINKHEP